MQPHLKQVALGPMATGLKIIFPETDVNNNFQKFKVLFPDDAGFNQAGT